MVDDFNRKTRIKHMMVQTSVFTVSLRSFLEGIESSSIGIFGEIVKLQNFLQVCQISLRRLSVIILNQVLHGGDRPTVIEGPVLMRHNENQKAILSERGGSAYSDRFLFGISGSA